MDDFIVISQDKIYINELFAFTPLSSRMNPGNPGLFKGHSFCIAVSPDPNRLPGYLPDPYFKLCTADSIDTYGAGISRFYFRNLRIDKHGDGPEIKITTRLLNDLNIALDYKVKYRGSIEKYPVFKVINMFLEDFAKDKGYRYLKVDERPDFKVLAGYRNAGNAIDMYK